MAKLAKDWTVLHKLARLKSDVEFARLSGIKAEVSRKQSNKQELVDKRTDRHSQIFGLTTPDCAQISGADAKWNAWVDAKIQTMNPEISASLGKYEQQRKIARLAFGRSEVTKRLLSKFLHENR